MSFDSSFEIIENWSIGALFSPVSNSHSRYWEINSFVILIEITTVIIGNYEFGEIGRLSLELGNDLVGRVLIFKVVKNLLSISFEIDQKVFLLKLRGSVTVVVNDVVDKDFIFFSLISNFLRVDLENFTVEVLFNSFTIIKKFSIRDLALVNNNHGL